MSTELATAYIALVPTTRGIAGQLETQIVGPATAAGNKAGTQLGGGIAKGSKSGLLTAKNAITGLGLAAAVAAVKSVQGFSAAGKEVAQLKRQVGGSAEEMSRLRFAAAQTGINTATLARSFVLLSKNGASGKLDEFGVSLKNADGSAKPLTAQLSVLADKFVSLGSTQEKNRFLMAAFGRGGAEMGKLLGKGGDGIAALEKEADKLGVTLTEENLKAVSDNLAATRKFSAAIQGLEIKLGQGLIPVVTAAADVATKLTTAFSGQPKLLRNIEVGALAAGLAYAKLVKPLIGLGSKINTGLAGIGGGGEAAANAAVASASTAQAAAQQAAATTASELAAAEQAATVAGAELATVMGAETASAETLALATANLDAAMLEVTLAKQADTIASGEAATANAALATSEEVAAGAAGGLSLSLGSVVTGAAALIAPTAILMKIHNDGTAAGKRYAAALVEGQSPLEALATLQKAVFEPGQTIEHWKGIETQLKLQSAALLSTGSSTDILAAAEQHLFEGIPQWKINAAVVLANQRAILASLPTVDAVTGKVKHWGDTLAAAGVQARLAANGTSAFDKVLDSVSKQSSLSSAFSAAQKANQDFADNARTAAGGGAEIAALRKQAADAETQSAEQIKAAREGVATAIEAEANAVRDAQAARATLAADTLKQTTLVAGLKDAYKAAAVSLRELKEGAASDKLSVKEAEIRLRAAQRAQREGADPTKFDPDAQLSLDIAVERAQENLTDAKEAEADSQTKLNQANKDGLSKSPEVLAQLDLIHQGSQQLATDKLAIVTADRAVQTAEGQVAKANEAVTKAIQDGRDKQKAAYDEIGKKVDEAKKKQGELKTAATEAAIAYATAAKDAKLPVTAILSGLKTLSDQALPEVSAAIDAIRAKFTLPLSAGAGGANPGPTATNATSGSSSGGTTIPDLFGKGPRSKGAKGGGAPFPTSVPQQTEAQRLAGVAADIAAHPETEAFYRIAFQQPNLRPFFASQNRGNDGPGSGRGDVLVEGDLIVRTDSRTGRELVRDVNEELGKRIR